MSEEEIRRNITDICHKIYEKGFVVATDGNVSVRVGENRIITTPSGLCKGLMKEKFLVVTDMDGNKLSGEGKPSSELRMHLRAYRERKDVKAVIHSHPPISTSFSIAGVRLAQCVLPEVVLTMGSIPTTDYATPTTEEGPEVIGPYIKDYDAMILDRHGALTVGETLQKAYEKLEKLEHCAHITLMARQLGKVSVLSPEQINKIIELRKKFGINKKFSQNTSCSDCGSCITDKQSKMFDENIPGNIVEIIAEEIKKLQQEKHGNI